MSRRIVAALPDPLLPGLRVVTPNRRAARHLGAAPLSLESLARERLRDQGLRPVGGFEAWQMLQRLRQGSPLENWPAERLLAEIRGLLQLPLTDWDAHRGDLEPRLQALVDLSHQYLEQLSERGLSDDAERFRRAAATTGPAQPLLIWGYWDSQPDQLAWIDRIAGEGSLLVLPYAEALSHREQLAWLQAQGWELALTPVEPEPWVARWFGQAGADTVKALSYANREAEVRGVLAQVKQLLLQGVPQSDILLLAEDDREYGPLVEQVGWEYGLPVRLIYEVPLVETRCGRWLGDLATAIADGFSYASGQRVFAPGFCTGLPEGRQAQFRRQRPAQLTDWLSLQELDLPDWPEVAPRSEWAARLRRWIRVLGLRAGFRRWPRDLVALNGFLRVQLPQLAEPAAEPIGRQEWCRELEQLLRLARTPVQPGQGGVELNRPEQVVGGHIPHVFLLGLNEGVWPAPPAESPLLDFSECRRLRQLGLGVASAPEQVSQAQVRWLGALAAAGVPRFSWVRLHENREQWPSAYLDRLDLKSTPAEVGSPVSDQEQRQAVLAGRIRLEVEDDILRAARQHREQERSRQQGDPRFNGQLAESVPLPTADKPLSVTGMIQLGQCPFRWAVAKLLNLRADPERSEDPDAATQGTLLHKVLELLFPQLQRPTPPALEVILEAVDQAAQLLAEDSRQRRPDLRRNPRWPALRRSYAGLLERLMAAPVFRSPGSTPLAVEQSFDGVWHGLPVRGTIDRVDATDTGLELIDYKLGSSVQKAWSQDGKLNLDLQLELYRAAGVPALYPEVQVGTSTVRYLHLRKASESKPREPKAEDLAALAQRLLDAFEHGCFPIRPDTAYCGYCDFAGLCRHQDRPGDNDATD